MQKQVVVIAGPTGSGETSVTNEIVKRFPDRVTRLVTATTRAPRAGEKSGADYYFFSNEEFERQKKLGNILESTYIANRNTYYGTYAPDLNEKISSNKIIIVNPDIIGAQYFKKNYNAVTVFIVPESLNNIEHRIRERNPDLPDEEVLKRRANAEAEIRNEESYYDYKVTNADGKLGESAEHIVAILTKEGYNLK